MQGWGVGLWLRMGQDRTRRLRKDASDGVDNRSRKGQMGSGYRMYGCGVGLLLRMGEERTGREGYVRMQMMGSIDGTGRRRDYRMEDGTGRLRKGASDRVLDFLGWNRIGQKG